MKSLKLSFIITCLFVALQTEAQVIGQNFGHSFYIGSGYAYIDADDLQRLVPVTGEGVENNFFTVGAGAHHQLKGIVVGVNFDMAHGRSGFRVFGESDEAISTETRVMRGIASVGYAIIDMEKIKLFPTVGIGMSKVRFNATYEGDLAVSPFGGLAPAEYNLTKRNLMFDFAINLRHLFGKEKDGVTSGFMPGLKVGYQLTVKNDKWKHSGGDVNNAPDYGPNGFYVQAVLGFGKFSPQKMTFCKHKKEKL